MNKSTAINPAHILHRKRKLHRKGALFNYSSALYQTLQDYIYVVADFDTSEKNFFIGLNVFKQPAVQFI